MKNEPILNWGMVVAAVAAGIGVLVTVFGVPISADGVKAIMAFMVTIGPLVTALVTWLIARQRTWPDRKVVRVSPDAVAAPAVGLSSGEKSIVEEKLKIVEDLQQGRGYAPRSNAESRG